MNGKLTNNDTDIALLLIRLLPVVVRHLASITVAAASEPALQCPSVVPVRGYPC